MLNEEGFTLLELMLALFICGLLANFFMATITFQQEALNQTFRRREALNLARLKLEELRLSDSESITTGKKDFLQEEYKNYSYQVKLTSLTESLKQIRLEIYFNDKKLCELLSIIQG